MTPPWLWQFFRQLKLAWKFSLAFMAIVLAMLLGLYAGVVSLISESIYSEYRDRGLAISRNLATNLIDPILLDSVPRIQLLLNNAGETTPEIAYSFLSAPNGRIVAHTFTGGFPTSLKAINRPGVTQSYSLQAIETGRGNILDIAIPILGGDSGVVHVGFSTSGIDGKMALIRQSIFWISLLVALLAIGLASWLSRLITRPLSALAAGAEKIRQGNLDYRVAIAAPDEVGAVTNAFNQMVDTLQNDISRRIRAEKDLANEKERLAVTLRSIGDGVITTNVTGEIQLVNQVAEQLTGWTQTEALGKPLSEVFRIIGAQTRLICEDPIEKVLDSRRIIGFDNQALLICRCGKELHINNSFAPIMDDDGKVVGVVLVFRDVTDQLRKEKELLKIAKLESLGVLAGGIAHDFNNVLMAILGNLNLSQLDPDLKKSTRDYLDKAARASARAKGLTQQLLTFAKGGAPVKETTSLTEVVMDSANFVLSGQAVSCRFDIPPDLWLVDIDKGQISQVVQNLTLNACQAMPDGGVIEISFRNQTAPAELDRKEGRFVIMTIRDHGEGIPAQAADKIFDPFFSTKPGGSGLGLSITNSIVAKHGGRITFDTSPGNGTAFSVFLPASESDAAQTAPPEEIYCPPPGTKTILVMDDEEMIRDVARAMLVHLGHEVLLARDGEEAISIYLERMAAGRAPDLVIMDLTIPGAMGGQEAARGLSAIDPEAKVVVASGYSNDPVLAEYNQHGFIASISKPFQLDELKQVIATLFS